MGIAPDPNHPVRLYFDSGTVEFREAHDSFIQFIPITILTANNLKPCIGKLHGHQAATSGVIAITEMAKAAYSPISRGINI